MKICYISDISRPLKLFVMPQAEYIHKKHPEWQISFVCNNDELFSKSLPTYFNYEPIKFYDSNNKKSETVVKTLEKLFKDKRYDIIIYTSLNGALVASEAGKKAGISNRVYLQWGIVYVARKGLNRLLYKCKERKICKLSTFILPDSKANLEFCLKEKLYSKEKGEVIWNGSAKGIDLNKFDISKKGIYRKEIREQCGLKECDKVIGFVGKFSKEKGCEELLSAFKEVSSVNRDAKLLFIGAVNGNDGVSLEMFDFFEQSIDIIKISNVDNIEKYLAAMDVFVLPSYREGFGMSVIEAQAMGVPAVVTEYPGPESAILKNQSGFVVKLYNSKDIITAVEKLFDNPKLLISMGEVGRKFVEESFEQERFMEKALDIISGL